MTEACATNDMILAVVENRLRPHEYAAFTNHLAGCGGCAALLAAATAAWFPKPVFGKAGTAPAHFLPGERFGPYVISAFAGRGAMGEVYRARDLRLGRDVAMKTLPARFIDDPERLARFQREARATGGIAHPNALTLFDLGTQDGIPYLVSEWLEGSTLYERLARGPLPIRDVLRIGVQLANGLAAAHATGVIHRDLKPANVFLCTNGGCKILDFGLARLAAHFEADAASEVGTVLGTAGYMSPEQVRGEAVDERTDLFGVGAVLHEMITGRPVFGAGSPVERMSATLRDEAPELSGELGAVIARCLAKDPSKRFRSAHDLAFHLTALEARRSEPSVFSDAGENLSAAPSSSALSADLRWPLLSAALSLVVSGVAVAPRVFGGNISSKIRVPWLFFAAVLGALIGFAATRDRWFMNASPTPAAGSSAVASRLATAPARSGCMVDLPLPTSISDGAITAYKSAIQSFHDSNWGQAELSLRDALKLDPTLSIAHLRLALIISYLDYAAPEAKAEYREAIRFRGSLAPRDLRVLEALEPLLNNDTADLAETVRRFDELTKRYPFDAEIFNLLGVFRHWEGPAGQLEAARQAVTIDPDYADGWSAVGVAAVDSDPATSSHALDRCISIAPTASDCRLMRAGVESALGRCVEAEQQIRRATDDPHASEDVFLGRAMLLYALGEPIEAVTEAFRQRWTRIQVKSAAREDTLYDTAIVAIAYGDFATAKSKGEEGLALVGPQAPLRAHARFLELLAEIEIETGHPKAAAAIASSYLARKNAWQRGLPFDDPTVYMTRLLARAGGLSERAARSRRDSWFESAMATVKKQPTLQRSAWLRAYVQGIERQDEAVEALAVRPERDRPATFDPTIDMSLGQTLALAGNSEEALPYLERAHRRCDRLTSMIWARQLDLLYAEVLANRGDRGGACAVLGSILEHWRVARPPSVTATRAEARSVELGCEQSGASARRPRGEESSNEAVF